MKKREVGFSFDEIARKLIIVSSVFFIISIVFLSIVTDTRVSLVFLGMTPLLVYTITFFIMYIYRQLSHPVVWILPVLFPLLYLIMWNSNQIALISGMDGPIIAVLNILFCYGLNALYFLVYKKKRKKIVSKTNKDQKRYDEWMKYYHESARYHMGEAQKLRHQLESYKRELEINKNNFSVKLRGIEDKCKALNFVIGRVYSDKNNGNASIRDKLKIDRELYNSFSTIKANFEEKHAKHLLDVLTKIYLKLTTLEMTEEKVFGKEIHEELDRDLKIIEILDKLDKDPVMESFDEAKEVCVSVIKFLKEKYNIDII